MVAEPPTSRRVGNHALRREPALALLPLRLFLGVTFVYGGIQKLSDPGFLHPGSPTWIGSQLQGFANHTPGGFLLRALAQPQPRLAGIGVALVEILVGLLVTCGLLTRLAAVGGLGLSLLLFLTASWHTHPYFLGSDIVFVFAWVPFVLVGAAGQPALDHEIGRRAAARMRRGARGGHPADAARTRRELLAQGLAGAAAATGVLAIVSALVKGPYRSAGTAVPELGGGPVAAGAPAATAATPATAAGGGAATTTTPPAGTAPSAPAAATPTAAPQAVAPARPALPAGAVRLGSASRLGRGQAASYRDPSDGSPDLAIRHSDGRVTALSAVCTHAGCACQYQGGQLVCPCHGSVFDATTGAVIQGPADQPLPVRRILERDGTLYALKA